VKALSHLARASPKLVRAAGAAAAAAWTCLSLLERAAWPRPWFAIVALSLAAGVVLRPVELLPRLLMAPRGRLFVGACALVAAGVSLWFTQHWMRKTPIVIDAGVYLMQARAMAHLHFGMRAPSPLQAFSNHFVLEGEDQRLYGVFPPGWPLALVPFVWIGAPMLAGPAMAALLVVAQAALGRAIGRAAGDEHGGELATRVSLLLSLPSYARAVETADLLSHALVAILAAVAVTCAIRVAGAPGAATQRRLGVLLGGCVGWATAARLLDGIVVGAAVAGVLVWTRHGRDAVRWMTLGAAPFLVLLLIEQRCATGAWLLPTQTAYFVRSDWPTNCHRLGMGPGVGCTVEHAAAVANFGPGGYDLSAALRVTRERARVLGEDLLGFPPLALLAFGPLVWAASAIDAIGAAFLLALTLTYGLFYYGNAVLFGARHLFPAAPFVWLLAARACVTLPDRPLLWLDARRARGACIAVLLAVAGASARGPWLTRARDLAASQAERSDLRRTLAREGIDHGIVVSHDQTAVAAAFDSWQTADGPLFVVDDGSGLLELRRAHPGLQVLLSLPGDALGKAYATVLPRGMLVELERAWPTFVRPSGLATKRAAVDEASGGAVLRLSHAQPGAEVAIPFEVAVAADYLVRVDGVAGPDQGNYLLTLDGSPLADWNGYGAQSAARRGQPAARTIGPGRHTLIVRCVGRDARSSGYDALLDDLVGELPQDR
jgi:hypothetical protein